jgi:ABC-type antimicrobial peptide transport system permease subunit
MYLSLYQYHDPSVILHVRTGADPLALAPAVIDSIRAMDHRLPVFDVMTFAEHLELGVFMQRMAATLLGFFGGLALLLATTGLYGVLAFLAAQRTREIGIRMALGADRGSVVWMILRQGLVVTVAGLALGLVLAAGATRLLGSQLIGVGPFDPLSLGATLAVLLSATLLACYLPARRASRQDPLQALRYE